MSMDIVTDDERKKVVSLVIEIIEMHDANDISHLNVAIYDKLMAIWNILPDNISMPDRLRYVQRLINDYYDGLGDEHEHNL